MSCGRVGDDGMVLVGECNGGRRVKKWKGLNRKTWEGQGGE